MNYGFVYILHNPMMRCLKIGCTERSPHARADELSKPTGVPIPFKVACYVEVRDFQAFERRMHDWCKAFRISDSREFFDEEVLHDAVALMYHYPDKLAFTVADAGYVEGELFGPVSEVFNPWAPVPTPAAQAPEGPALRVVGGADVGGFE